MVDLKMRLEQSRYFWRKHAQHGFKIRLPEFSNAISLAFHDWHLYPGCLGGRR